VLGADGSDVAKSDVDRSLRDVSLISVIVKFAKFGTCVALVVSYRISRKKKEGGIEGD
jgi:hypothetical protein